MRPARAAAEAVPVLLDEAGYTAQMPRQARFVTPNGKRFDAGWLRVRSAAHGVAPTRRDILGTYLFCHKPHADLYDLLGVDSPRADMGGAAVSAAVAAGDLARVADYCGAAVVATLACFECLRLRI